MFYINNSNYWFCNEEKFWFSKTKHDERMGRKSPMCNKFYFRSSKVY